MSMFSEKLKEIIQKKQVKIYNLSSVCQIDRTVLYKYISGDRKISAKDFQKLEEGLRLTPMEKEELQSYYKIAEMGEEDYLRRKNTAEFLSAGRSAPWETESLCPPRETARTRDGPFYGMSEVIRAVRSVLAEEMEKERGEVLIMAQPEDTWLFHTLSGLAQERKSCTVRHILCLESTEKNGDNCYNLSCLQNVMRIFVADCDYIPYYYYDSVQAHFSNNNLLPSLIVTGNGALQLAKDAGHAICHRDKESVAFFQQLFHGALQNAQPLCGRIHTVPESLAFYEQIALRREPPRFGCAAEPSLMPYLSRVMLERYVNWNLPGVEALVDQLMDYIHELEKNRDKYRVLIDYFTLEGLDCFCRTGRFWQIPDFACAPFQPGDRYELLRRYCGMWGGCRVHLMCRPSMPRLPMGMGTMVYRDGEVSFIQKHANKAYTVFILREKSLSYCFEDLLDYLERSGGVYSQEETLAIVQEKMEELKAQF